MVKVVLFLAVCYQSGRDQLDFVLSSRHALVVPTTATKGRMPIHSPIGMVTVLVMSEELHREPVAVDSHEGSRDKQGQQHTVVRVLLDELQGFVPFFLWDCLAGDGQKHHGCEEQASAHYECPA